MKTPTIEFELYSGGKTPTIGSDLEYKVEGTMVTKECQVLQIAIYVGLQR